MMLGEDGLTSMIGKSERGPVAVEATEALPGAFDGARGANRVRLFVALRAGLADLGMGAYLRIR